MTGDTGEEQCRVDRTQKARKYKEEGGEDRITNGSRGGRSSSGGQCLRNVQWRRVTGRWRIADKARVAVPVFVPAWALVCYVVEG